MGDLISRKAVLESLRIVNNMVAKYSSPSSLKSMAITTIKECMDFVSGMETAYDVDKVVERLDGHSEISLDLGASVVKLTDAIKIAKGGGQSE